MGKIARFRATTNRGAATGGRGFSVRQQTATTPFSVRQQIGAPQQEVVDFPCDNKSGSSIRGHFSCDNKWRPPHFLCDNKSPGSCFDQRPRFPRDADEAAANYRGNARRPAAKTTGINPPSYVPVFVQTCRPFRFPEQFPPWRTEDVASCTCSHDVRDHDPATQACRICFCPSWTLYVNRGHKAPAWAQPRTYEPRPKT
jgi:hypothetical protein